jgi:hypothetical protein
VSEPLTKLSTSLVNLAGSFADFPSVAAALDGVYGAWVNTDGFTVSQANEIFAGIRIYELAKELKIKHFVWSGTPYSSKVNLSGIWLVLC